MMTMRLAVVCLLLAVPPFVLCEEPRGASRASPPAGDVLTLDQALRLALENNRTLRSAALEVEAAQARVDAAKTRRLPSLELSANGSRLLTPVEFLFEKGQFGTFPATGPIPDKDTVIRTENKPSAYVTGRAAQPLSQLYSINLGVKLREVSREIDREQARAQRLAVVKDVKKLYYALLQTTSALEAADESLKVYRELDRVVGQYVAREVALKSDGMDVSARLAGAELKALSVRHDLAGYKEQMNELLGRDIAVEFDVGAVPELRPVDLDRTAAQARALERRPEVKEARLRVDQADYDRRIKKAELIPEVSLAVSYYSFFGVKPLPRNVAALGVQVKWEPFDWGRKGRELAEKSRAADQARTAVAQTEARVQIDVNNRLRRLEEAGANVRVNELAAGSAREKVRVAMNRFKQEAALLKDVLEAQASAAQASAEHDRALAALWTARAELGSALGEEE